MTTHPVSIIGGGLAGSEAAAQLLRRNIPCQLYEMRPLHPTPAHKTHLLAELVCSNSLRNCSTTSAIGLLQQELHLLSSLVIEAAHIHRLPAGQALAVDRLPFSQYVHKQIVSHPLLTLHIQEVSAIPVESSQHTILASGPLTSSSLVDSLQTLCQQHNLFFFDATAPIVHYHSINLNYAYKQSRYQLQKTTEHISPDYINCPLTKTEYLNFIADIQNSQNYQHPQWETQALDYFEGCLPMEVMAQRGSDTLRFGPLKPVGLINPYTKRQDYAVIQLRKDNSSGTLWNMVGLQTSLKHQEQIRVFQKIPALAQAQFARLGSIHKNTYLNSPTLLNHDLTFKNCPRVSVAGQISGVEGYVESAAIGALIGLFISAKLLRYQLTHPPHTTAMGSLLHYLTNENYHKQRFKPTNINFGLFPRLPDKLNNSKQRRQFLAERSQQDFLTWLNLHKSFLQTNSTQYNTGVVQ